MNKLSDLASVQRTLRKGIESGRWTLEDLDAPSKGFMENTDLDRTIFGGGYEGVQHRNLLRDEVKPHPETVPASIPPTQAIEPNPDPCPF